MAPRWRKAAITRTRKQSAEDLGTRPASTWAEAQPWAAADALREAARASLELHEK